MEWFKHTPTEDGLYWVKLDKKEEAKICEFHLPGPFAGDDEPPSLWFIGVDWEEEPSPDFWYLGPIEVPTFDKEF